jgi:small subunit ribosomal protein S20
MANIKSAKKRARQNEKRRQVNLCRKTAVKSSIKKLMKAIESGESKEKVLVLFNETQVELMRAKGKRLMHKNAASRKISRLAKKIAK